VVVTDFTYLVPPAPAVWLSLADPSNRFWVDVPALPPFICADGKGTAVYSTTTRLCADMQRLYVHFHCEDNDIWGHYTARDQPIYNEEVVELFLAPGADDPTHYYEFEVSPNGVLFDAEIINPTSNRADIQVKPEWNCTDIQWTAERCDKENWWTAVLIIPWSSIAPSDQLPTVWRANFYRIERPHGQPHEFSCWSPTHTDPADFHKPVYFGRLQLPFS
jgi:hypothetical protein